MAWQKFPLMLIVLCASLWPKFSAAAAIKGVVYDDQGQTIEGVMLTLTGADGLYAETVYSNAKGEFHLVTSQQSAASLRARRLNFADNTTPVELAAGNVTGLALELRRQANSREPGAYLTASAHLSKLNFADPVAEGFFRIECLTCHQLGNGYTRTPRSEAQWTQIVSRMLGYWGINDEDWTAAYVKILGHGFDGTAPQIKQVQHIDPEIFSARITQWKLPRGVIAHDVVHHSRDGKFYTVDQGLDLIYITDPVTNVTEEFKIPNGGIPIGGKFLSVMGIANPLGLSVSRGPHSLQEGPDGRLYTTDTVSGQIGVFDPVTRSYVGHDVGGKAMYPHTLRFDKSGLVWFTVAMSN